MLRKKTTGNLSHSSSTEVSDMKISSVIKKAFSSNSTWEDKDLFLDVIYWIRQVFAVFNGIAWGIIPLNGILGLALFFVINCAIVYAYVSKMNKIDEDDFGGIQELVKEGLFTAFAVFLVCWIMVYTSLHG